MKPVDRNGKPLKLYDKVEILHYWNTLEHGWNGNVLGFEEKPDYDKSCVGIYTNFNSNSIHPSLIVKVE